MTKIETITALEVCDGDVVFCEGIRCRVSNAICYLPRGHFFPTVASYAEVRPCARYTLNSEPSETHKRRLPPGYEGMASGGNNLATVGREIK